MQKFDMNLLEYERILRKQYKIIVFCLVMVMVSSLFFMRSKTRLYRAGSSVKIDKTMENSGMIPDSYWDNMETQVMVVTSSPVMEIAAKELGIIDTSVPSDEIRKNEKLIRIIQGLSSKVTAKMRGNSTIIDLTVVSGSPKETKSLANSVATSYKLFSKREKSRTVRETRLFIEKQLNKCKADLTRDEMALKQLMLESTFPTIDEKLRKTLVEQSDLIKANKELGGRIEEIIAQMSEVEKRKNWNDFSIKDKQITDQERPYIDWISNVGAPDPGLEKLNDHLLALELKKSEALNFYQVTHPKLRDMENEILNILSQITREYSSRLNLLRKRFDVNSTELEACRAILADIPEEQQAFSKIQRNLASNSQLFDMLSSKYQLAMISEAGSADEVTVLSYAVTPTEPFNINTTKVIIISLIIGFMLGIMIALLIETIDTSIGTIEDMEEYLKIPVIGVLPHTRRDETLDIVQNRTNDYSLKQEAPFLSLITLFDPKSPDAEAFRSLRTNIQFLDIKKSIKVISFTSSVMQEGKSTTLANLALTMAQAGNKTLLIGCNLRRPSLHRVFGIPKGPGVIDILIEKDTWQNCIRTLNDSEFDLLKNSDQFGVSGLENLHIITSGGIPPNPSELLQSKNMDLLLKDVRNHYDIVLVDCPPILPVTDAAIMGTKVDGTVIIYQTGRVPRNALRRAKMKLESVNTNVLGLVLNDTKSEVSGYFTGYYRYYMDEKGMTKKKKRRKRSGNFGLRSLVTSFINPAGFMAAVDLVRRSMLVQILAVGVVSVSAFKALSYRMLSTVESETVSLSEPAVPTQKSVVPDSVAASVKAVAPETLITLEAESEPEEVVEADEVEPVQTVPAAAPAVKPASAVESTLPSDAPVYFLQLSSWPTREQALEACMSLKMDGVTAYVRSYEISGQVKSWRVCLGEYTTRDDAQTALGVLPSRDRLKGVFANRSLGGVKINPNL